MSIWNRISEAISALTQGEALSAVFDRLRTPPERSVAFTIAVIALGAKMAKADGQVTRDEVTAFREVFHIAQADEAQAAKLFNLARKDVGGFEIYAAQVARMFGAGATQLNDLLEGLFHIAMADGQFHPNEDSFLSRVAEIFELSQDEFQRIKSRFVEGEDCNPFDILGVPPDAPIDQIRAAWRKAVLECHPDRLVASGLPEEAVKLGEKRLVVVNRAWEQISGKG